VTRTEWLSRTYASRIGPVGGAGHYDVWRVEVDLAAAEPVLPVQLRRENGGLSRQTPWRKGAAVELTVVVRVPCAREEAALLLSEGDRLHSGAAWPVVSWPGGGEEIGLVAKRDTRDSHGRWRLRQSGIGNGLRERT
jgi:hypothetical protein